mmetsp:Transcript_36729/g.113237  ORF Transcript_36729/g.113237 Transcript_36729/m.113237 type:complete len:354 (+) Transcript_36729:660-1721(+)
MQGLHRLRRDPLAVGSTDRDRARFPQQWRRLGRRCPDGRAVAHGRSLAARGNDGGALRGGPRNVGRRAPHRRRGGRRLRRWGTRRHQPVEWRRRAVGARRPHRHAARVHRGHPRARRPRRRLAPQRPLAALAGVHGGQRGQRRQLRLRGRFEPAADPRPDLRAGRRAAGAGAHAAAREAARPRRRRPVGARRPDQPRVGELCVVGPPLQRRRVAEPARGPVQPSHQRRRPPRAYRRHLPEAQGRTRLAHERVAAAIAPRHRGPAEGSPRARGRRRSRQVRVGAAFAPGVRGRVEAASARHPQPSARGGGPRPGGVAPGTSKAGRGRAAAEAAGAVVAFCVEVQTPAAAPERLP